MPNFSHLQPRQSPPARKTPTVEIFYKWKKVFEDKTCFFPVGPELYISGDREWIKKLDCLYEKALDIQRKEKEMELQKKQNL